MKSNSGGYKGCENEHMENRIRELRELRGLSQADLGARVGLGKWDVSRLENGKTQLKLEMAQRIAEALDVTIAEVLALDHDRVSSGGFAETNLEEYVAEPGDPFAALKGEHRYLMRAKDDALDKIGIARGDVLVVDDSKEFCEKPPAMRAVRVQFHPDPARPSYAVTLLRQYVPPSMLITNSSRISAPQIDMDKEDAQILGVVVSTHRALNG